MRVQISGHLRRQPGDALELLATQPWPGVFGVFYETERPTKNRLETDLIARAREKSAGKSDLQLLQSTFARLR